MKKKIGVLVRPDMEQLTINREISDVIVSHNCIPIGIVPTCDEGVMSPDSFQDMIDMLSLCDGVILQGGNNFYDYDVQTVRYLYEHDIPTLGICLGMQTMGCVFGGTLELIENDTHHHFVDYVHSITLNPNSKLYLILKKDTIIVNSRHHEQLVHTSLPVVAHSYSVIEAIEDVSKKFFIGVQWHPESIHDENSQALFQAFFDSI